MTTKSPIRVAAPIVDNNDRKVGAFLDFSIKAGSDLSIVSAYFTIYAYEALRDALNGVKTVRFLYGEPHGVGSMDPDANEPKSFRLNEDGGIELHRVLVQKNLARDCAEWIQRSVEIRTIKQAGFLHGKLYHIADNNGSTAALVGSSNFTRRGLGYGATPNIELNLEVRDTTDRQTLIDWFNLLWNDKDRTKDVKNDVLAALARLSTPYSPEFVYYKTLFHVFADRLSQEGDREQQLRDIHHFDTEIWQKLYEFQKHGATSAINRLLTHNGCIIADSVGLGKTWTALAIIKFFELRNERVLVLCPKRLETNWTRYTYSAGQRNNPFERDRFNYTVLAHTDLSRSKGYSGQINLANFNWAAFDLIVIDESHNFRNEGTDKKDEAGRIRLSRYNRLLEEVVKDGVRTKLLMLSATPVNTSLRDLRNQIYLMTEKRQDAFRDALGINNIQTLFGIAQQQFKKWEEMRHDGNSADKGILLDMLGPRFLSLLDAVTIARSRDHLKRFYSVVTEKIGGFPQRPKPKNLSPATDAKGELSYDELHDQISGFRLAIYMPSQYLKKDPVLGEKEADSPFTQRDRERWLIGMMRTNLLKRLESSVHSFAQTTARLLAKIDQLQKHIESWEQHRSDDEIESIPDLDEEDEEFIVGVAHQYRLSELDIERWRQDLRDDKAIFSDIYDRARLITGERDLKLLDLKKELAHKFETAPPDKDGRPNRKALVFTTFTDTATYLYNNLSSWAHSAFGARVALVTGSAGNRSNCGTTQFDEILRRFAPKAQNSSSNRNEIDFLIATDCISEGQNLQDCDLVVNYDIHWNPVRLLQRFGRIDRLGSRNHEVQMINFWPTADLDRYLKLRNRVEARMALADATATGFDDPLNKEDAVRSELFFRDEQLKRVRDEILDIEDANDGVNISDLTLDDFLADLLQFIQQNRAILESAPLGIYAVAPARLTTTATSSSQSTPSAVRPGVLFCLRQKVYGTNRTPNRLWPYFLVYVTDNGKVRYSFKQSQRCLTLFRNVAAGKRQAIHALENTFDRETNFGQVMAKYNLLLDSALKEISSTFQADEIEALTYDKEATLVNEFERPDGSDSLELITWLVITQER